MTKTYIVDGSNLAHDERHRPTASRLASAVDALRTHVGGDAVLAVVVDANLRHRMPDGTETDMLRAMLESGLVTTTPPGVAGRGDSLIVQLAEAAIGRGEDVVVVSDDSFREYQRDHAWIVDDGRFLRGRSVAGYWTWLPANAVRARDAGHETPTGLAAVGIIDGHQEVYRVLGGRLEHRWHHHGWSDWHRMPLPDDQTAVTCAAAAHRSYIDLFVVTTAKTLLHRWWGPDEGWSGWSGSWGRATGFVAAASAAADHVEVFWSDGAMLRHRWYIDGGWCDHPLPF